MSKAPVAALRDWLASGELPDLVPEVAAAAVAQGLAGRLLAALGTGADVGPPLLLDRLRDARRVDLVRGVRLLDLGARAHYLLLARGLRSLPLKGAALAESLHGSVAFRPMLDVDLLALDPGPAAVEALLEEGYRDAAGADHARVLVDPVSGGILELHSSITSCPALFPVDREGLWSRSLAATGQIPRVPSTEDTLVQLALHAAFQHGLVLSLVQWLDFRLLLEQATIDIGQLVRIAAAARAGAALAAALLAAEAVVRAPVGPTLRAAVAGFLPNPKWLDRRLQEPLGFVAPAEPGLGRVRFELLAGRRRQLAAATLGLGRAGVGTSAVLGRAFRLARRWTSPTVRAWSGAWS